MKERKEIENKRDCDKGAQDESESYLLSFTISAVRKNAQWTDGRTDGWTDGLTDPH